MNDLTRSIHLSDPDDSGRRSPRRLRTVMVLCLTFATPALAADPIALLDPLQSVCLNAIPPGLLDAPDGFAETADRETFAGKADRFWMLPDESVRFGVTFTTATRACEFVVDDRALDEHQMQNFAGLALLAISGWAGEAADLDVTAPENIPTFRWTATPPQFNAPLGHQVELSSNEHQTLIRVTVNIQ